MGPNFIRDDLRSSTWRARSTSNGDLNLETVISVAKSDESAGRRTATSLVFGSRPRNGHDWSGPLIAASVGVLGVRYLTDVAEIWRLSLCAGPTWDLRQTRPAKPLFWLTR